MSRIGFKIVSAIAEPIAAVIRQGKPLPTTLGAGLGAAFGGSIGYSLGNFWIPGALLGAVSAAVAVALIAKRKPNKIDARADQFAANPVGEIKGEWLVRFEDTLSLIVVTEHWLYQATACQEQLDGMSAALHEGHLPKDEEGVATPLRQIRHFELANDQHGSLYCHYVDEGETLLHAIDLRTPELCTQFLEALESNMERGFDRSEGDMSLFDATIVPAALLILLAGLVFGAAWLSAHWIADPPPPPLGKTERDGLVKLLMWIGPNNILLGGTVPLTLSTGWLLYRIVSPPQNRDPHAELEELILRKHTGMSSSRSSDGDAFKTQARIPRTILPWTSVNRKSLPETR